MSKIRFAPMAGLSTEPALMKVCQHAPRDATGEGTCCSVYTANTAGTVRVNNAGNLETCIAYFEWGLSACFLVIGVGLALKAFRVYSFSRMTAFHRILLALTCFYLSIRMPGIFTWLILGDTSHRNLFS